MSNNNNETDHDRVRALREQIELARRKLQAAKQPPATVTNATLAENPYANRVLLIECDGRNDTVPLLDPVTTIGREPRNDIQIMSRFVSRFHARIVSDADGATVEDLDSRNGVKVNAERVRRHRLRSGDFIRVGRTRLQYLDILDGEGLHGRA